MVIDPFTATRSAAPGATRRALLLLASGTLAAMALAGAAIPPAGRALAIDASPSPPGVAASADPGSSPLPDPTPGPMPSPTPAPTPSATPGPDPTPAPTDGGPPSATIDPGPAPSVDPTVPPEPTPTPTPTPSPVAVTVTQSADAPEVGSRRVDPGATMHLTVTVTSGAVLPGGRLTLAVPPGWAVLDPGDGMVSGDVRTVAWSVGATESGSSAVVTAAVRAPYPRPGAAGWVSIGTFSAWFDQDGDTTMARALAVLVAPRVVMEHRTFALVHRQSRAVTFLVEDAPLDGLQRFTVFRVRFQARNADSVPVSWSPLLEWRDSMLAAWAPVPSGAYAVGMPFYVAREWIPDPRGTGGTILGPEGEPIATASLVSDETDATGESPSEGRHWMGVNPLPDVVLPPRSYTEIEFSVRATADATYGAGYELRVTDGGSPFSGAVSASLTMAPEPPLVLSPGQQVGLPVGAPVSAATPAATASGGTGLTYALRPAARRATTAALSAWTPTSQGGAAVTYPLVAPDPSTAASPHGPYWPVGALAGGCATCHRAHAARTQPDLGPPAPAWSICLGCHDGSRASTDVLATYQDPAIPQNDAAGSAFYRHDYVASSGTAHTSAGTNEWQAADGAPLLNRHSACADCHDPHAASDTVPVQTSLGWTLAGALSATSGVVVRNGPAGQAPAYTWSASTDPALDDGAAPPRTRYEYELCLKCHSGFTRLRAPTPGQPSTWALDSGVEFNPANGSYHPVEAAGTNATAAMQASLSGTSPYKLWDFQVSSTVRCVNCHGDPSRLAARPAADADLAPHASVNRGILLASYRDRLLPSATDDYAAWDFALCYLCHAEAPFADATGNVRDDTNFRFHGLHVSALQGLGNGGTDIDTAGAGQGNAVCSECHFRTHSTAFAVVADEGANPRLVNFAPNVGAGASAWVSTGIGAGTCTLTCHGEPHDESYARGASPAHPERAW